MDTVWPAPWEGVWEAASSAALGSPGRPETRPQAKHRMLLDTTFVLLSGF